MVIRIFTNSNARILTAFGPTPSFTAGDGIDQGDSLSPLIWRIYYDPLIKTLTTRGTPKPKPYGYEISCEWPTDPTKPHNTDDEGDPSYIMDNTHHTPTDRYNELELVDDKYRLIEKWFGTSDLSNNLMAIKD